MAPTNIDILAVHAAATPDKAAVIDDQPGGPTRTWTFVELNRRVNQLGHLLLSLGVRPGARIAWCGPNSAPIFALTGAARKLGAVAVPVNYRLTADEAAYVVDDSDSAVVFVDAEYAGLILGVRARLPNVSEVVVYNQDGGLVDKYADMLRAQPEVEPDVAVAEGWSASMIYTSGTTGKPKGALRSRTGDPDAIAALVALIGFQADDIYITTGPLYHSGPGTFAALALTLGNTIVVQRKFDAEDWLRLVDTYRVTTTMSAPTPIRMVCGLPDSVKARYDCSSMRRMLANAAPFSFALKQRYLTDFPPDSLWEGYGSTELGVNTMLAPADQLRKPGSCGLPAPGVEIKLFDDEGREITAANVAGELYVRSPNVFDTYHKAQDKYDQDRRGDFHTVGDIAYRDEEGYYYIADRKSDMIISGGMNIYPAEIEAALEQHPGIFDVAVFGIPSEQWGEQVHAVVVKESDNTGLTEGKIIDFARQRLATYKIPRSVSFTDELPRTGSGKLLKRELRAPFWAGHPSKVG